MKLSRKTIPNILTSIRIIGAIVLVFMEVMTVPFYIVYTLCGVTDALDGKAARAFDAQTERGAKLDSIADLLFYTVTILKLMPVLLKMMPGIIWYILAAVLAVRAVVYLICAYKYHRFASLHTIMNKITGLMVFFLPYMLLTPAAVAYSFGCVAAGGIGTIQEMYLHVTRRSYAK